MTTPHPLQLSEAHPSPEPRINKQCPPHPTPLPRLHFGVTLPSWVPLVSVKIISGNKIIVSWLQNSGSNCPKALRLGGWREQDVLAAPGSDTDTLPLSSQSVQLPGTEISVSTPPLRILRHENAKNSFLIQEEAIVKTKEVDEKNSVRGRINRTLKYLFVESLANKPNARVLRSFM